MVTLILSNPATGLSAAWSTRWMPCAFFAQHPLSASLADFPFFTTTTCSARFVLVLVVEMITYGAVALSPRSGGKLGDHQSIDKYIGPKLHLQT